MVAFKLMELVQFSKDRMWDREQRRAEGRVLSTWADLRLATSFFWILVSS